MNNLFEMMLQAQNGNAMQNMARQFGLQPEQAQSAVAAMLPAFQLGMQKQAETPDGLQELLKMFGGGQFAGIHDADGDGIPDEAEEQGKDVLGQLFGSKDVSRAVAAQASAMSGVSDAIIKQMLPVVAAMLMGGMFKGAMGNGLGGLLGNAMQGGLGDIMGRMMGGAQPQQPRANPMGSNPMADMMGNVLSGMMGGAAKPAPPPPQDPMAAGLDMLKGMFDSGQKVHKSQMDAFSQIFQQMAGGGRR